MDCSAVLYQIRLDWIGFDEWVGAVVGLEGLWVVLIGWSGRVEEI